MKERIWYIPFFSCLLLTALSALSLAFVQEEVPENADSPRRYVFMAPNREEEYWVEAASGAKEADREEGSDTLLVHTKNEGVIGEYIRDARLSGAGGIILKGTADASQEIGRAVSEGIPVIFYNSDFPESGRTTYVGHDNYAIGKLCGQLLVQAMGEEGNYLIFARRASANSFQDRVKGLTEYLADYPGIHLVDLVEDKGNLLTLREVFQEEIQKAGSLQGLVSLGGTASEHLGSLIEALGLSEQLSVIVTDLTDNSAAMLEKGIYDAVVSLDASQIGRKAVELLNDHDKNGAELPSQLMLPLSAVTAENLEEYRTDREDRQMEWNSYEP